MTLLPVLTFAQDKPQDKKSGKAEEKQTTDKTPVGNTEEKKKPAFVDANGDGIDDNASGTNHPERRRKGRMDRFVDKDGDGVNDCRAKGMGWSGKGKQNRFGRR